MSTNSDALRLAHWLEHELDPEGTVRFVAAAELRRLHDERNKLRALLQELIDIEGPQPGTSRWFAAVKNALGNAS